MCETRQKECIIIPSNVVIAVDSSHHTHTRTHTRMHTHTHAHTHTHTHTHTHARTYTHTHTHTLTGGVFGVFDGRMEQVVCENAATRLIHNLSDILPEP